MWLRKFSVLYLILSIGLASGQTVWHLKLKNYKVAELDTALNETSGLTFHNGRLFTLNDGGNSSELFEISPDKGKIIDRITLKARNNDWESLTSDGENIFIGDFGNNKGDRKDLSIIKLNLKTLDENFYPVYFPEQKDFTKGYFKHNYDTEAMVFYGKSLHVFSKEWLRRGVSHYVLDEFGNLQTVEYYKSRFLVTGAEYYDGKLYLVGYSRKGEVFMLRFEESLPEIFFIKKPRLYYLGMVFNIGQIEAIAANEKGLYISGEKFTVKGLKVPPTLYFVPFERLK